MNDKNLICFFSWGRQELTQQGFNSLLESIRPQDKLLVIDQQGLNHDFFIKHKDKIDFLFISKENYHISPVWTYIKNLVKWLDDKNIVYRCEKNEDVELGWTPDYINIIESDTIGKKGWIDRVLRGFNIGKGFPLENKIKIVSGYNGEEHPSSLTVSDFLIKEIVNGVNMIIEKDYFLELLDGLLTRKTAMDWKVSEKNLKKGNLVAVLPNEIKHTGDNQSRQR